jgi:hypothetical protein
MRRSKHLRNDTLAAEWKALRETACKYRFGRVELLPFEKSGKAVGLCLGDYHVKTYNATQSEKRYRLVRFSKKVNQADWQQVFHSQSRKPDLPHAVENCRRDAQLPGIRRPRRILRAAL